MDVSLGLGGGLGLCAVLRGSPANSTVISELHLCYPVQTFRPKLEPVGKCPYVQRGPLGQHGHSSSEPRMWGSL